MGEPLLASDWLLPNGAVLVVAAPSVDASPMCSQLAADFKVANVRGVRSSPAVAATAPQPQASTGVPKAEVTCRPNTQSNSPGMYEVVVNVRPPEGEGDTAPPAVARPPPPPAVDMEELADSAVAEVGGGEGMVLVEVPHAASVGGITHALRRRNLPVRSLLVLTGDEAAVGTESSGGDEGKSAAVRAAAKVWMEQGMPAVQHQARELDLRMMYIACDGSFDEQMTNLLCALNYA